MSKTNPPIPTDFPKLLKEIKARIQQAQTRAILSANAELVRLYWDVGRIIHERQAREGWGAAVIPRLARELRNDLPEQKGFSERNIGRMIAFYRAYPDLTTFLPPPVAKSPCPEESPPPAADLSAPEVVPRPAVQSATAMVWSVPWAHHVILLEKVKDISTRIRYMQQTRALPASLQSALPTVEEIEAELSEAALPPPAAGKAKPSRPGAKKTKQRVKPGKARRK